MLTDECRTRALYWQPIQEPSRTQPICMFGLRLHILRQSSDLWVVKQRLANVSLLSCQIRVSRSQEDICCRVLMVIGQKYLPERNLPEEAFVFGEDPFGQEHHSQGYSSFKDWQWVPKEVNGLTWGEMIYVATYKYPLRPNANRTNIMLRQSTIQTLKVFQTLGQKSSSVSGWSKMSILVVPTNIQ